MQFDRYVTGLLVLLSATLLLLGLPAYIHFAAMHLPGFSLPPQFETIGFVEARLSLAFAAFTAVLALIFAALHWREATTVKGASILALALAVMTTGPFWYYRANVVEHRITDGEISRDRTIARLSAELQTSNVESQTSNERVAKLISATTRLNQYRFRSQSQLSEANASIDPQNNPFSGDKAAIRSIKKSATSMASMWDALTPFAARYHHFNDRRDMAIGAMLVVGAFYDFGNPYPNDEKGGCVSINQDTNYQSIGDLTFAAMTQSDIGCCTDFTLMLVSFLRHLDYDVNAVITSGHQTAQVNIDGHSHLIDANTLIFAEDFFSSAARKLIYFTPYSGTRIQQFQQYELVSLAFGLEHFGPGDWKVYNPVEHAKLFQAYFLNDNDLTSSSVK